MCRRTLYKPKKIFVDILTSSTIGEAPSHTAKVFSLILKVVLVLWNIKL